MSNAIPCTRHGIPGADDPALRTVIDLARQASPPDLETGLASLSEIEGQLWVTWRDETMRDSLSGHVTDAWRQTGAAGRVLHLVPCDDDYDYQEDAMNNPAD